MGFNSIVMFKRDGQEKGFKYLSSLKVSSGGSKGLRSVTGENGQIRSSLKEYEKEKYGLRVATEQSITGEDELKISKIYTTSISSCTVFMIMSESYIIFAHVDSRGLETFYDLVMNTPFEAGKTKVFASRITGSKPGDVEHKRVQEMIDYINPEEFHVIDRENSLEHGKIGVLLREGKDKTSMTIMCDVTKGHIVGGDEEKPIREQTFYEKTVEFPSDKEKKRKKKKRNKGKTDKTTVTTTGKGKTP